MTKGITTMNLPSAPGIKNIGEKAMSVVSTVTSTGPATSLKPSTAASTGFLPSSRCRLIFSAIMMASSTSIPKTRIIAESVITSSATSNKGSKATAPKRLTGIPMATQKAVRKFRNMASMARTS